MAKPDDPFLWFDLSAVPAVYPCDRRVVAGRGPRNETDHRRGQRPAASGHGGKAVYRGDKVTRRVWAEIQLGGYIAQEFAKPGERRIAIDSEFR